MPNPHHFDSDWDYHDACLTPAQRLERAIADGESDVLVDQYLDWAKEQSATADWLLENDTLIKAFAEALIEWRNEP